MSNAWSRPAGRTVLLCLLVASSLATACSSRALVAPAAKAATTATATPRSIAHTPATLAGARGVYPSAPITIRSPAGRPVLAFPPATATATPGTVVYLHGMRGRAENGCPFMRSGASEVGWLVCPRGVQANADGTASWGADVFAQAPAVADALAAAERQGASREPGVAVGFSQGSYVALDLVKTKQASFRGLVLLAAPEAHPSAAKLKEAGVRRVALGAGRRDAAYAPLVADVARLRGEGMDARFFDLGDVGHTYDADDGATLAEAIAWAAGAG